MNRTTSLSALAVSLTLTLAACGGDDEGGGSSSGDGTTEMRVLIPAESPIEYPHRVAEAQGFFEEEGLATTYAYAGGSAEVIQQLVAGQGDVGVSCASAIVAGFEQGFTEVRPLFTTVYGSIFGMAVPGDSDITEVEQLEGKTIGISDPAGGEVPVVRGLLETAGLSEDDVKLLPIGEGTAVALRAVQNGDVDAIGGSFSDFVGLQVQGLELEYIGGDAISDLPACAVLATDDYLAENQEAVEGFLRGSAKGVLWGQDNQEETLEILREASPEGFADDLGAQMVELYMPLMAPQDEERVGDISADSYRAYFDFVKAEAPDNLDELINDEFIEDANDFDRAEVTSGG